jgi:hypothetical protein
VADPTVADPTVADPTVADPTVADPTVADPTDPATPPADAVDSSLIVARPDGEIVRTFDLEAYELEHNLDGQDQAGPDSVSNPVAVLAQNRRVLVADAGANAVLSIDRRTGEISEFFVPDVVTDVPGCGSTAADAEAGGCDQVPTGIAQGRNGLLYVSTLGADVPGAGRVYVLTQRGRVVDVIDGLNSPTDVAVDRRGTVYVSNVLGDQVTRIKRNGTTSTVTVPTPTGLLVERGGLYASTSSQGGPVGEVTRIGRGAFTSQTSPTVTDPAEPTVTDPAEPTVADPAEPTLSDPAAP